MIKYRMWQEIIKKHFSDAVIKDAALKFPITNKGWEIEYPASVDKPTFLVLQDMLTWETGTRWPRELERIATWAIAKNIDQTKLFVLIWNYDLAEHWNEQQPGMFRCIQFSTFQYNLWEQYTKSRIYIESRFLSTGHKHNALCLNRIDKPHRRAAISYLRRYREINLSDQHNGRNPYYAGLEYNEYDYNNLKNLFSLQQNYLTSRFSIITESQYSEPRGIISEKTFNAIVALHPFVIIGSVGSLKEIQRLGFKTFSDYFDESYDGYPNGVRLDRALGLPEIHKFRPDDSIKEICKYNREYFFNGFGKKLESDFHLSLSHHSSNIIV
jgi:hypothetical protein